MPDAQTPGSSARTMFSSRIVVAPTCTPSEAHAHADAGQDHADPRDEPHQLARRDRHRGCRGKYRQGLCGAAVRRQPKGRKRHGRVRRREGLEPGEPERLERGQERADHTCTGQRHGQQLVDVEISASARGERIVVAGVKRGRIASGDGDDTIKVTGKSNGTKDNLSTVLAGYRNDHASSASRFRPRGRCLTADLSTRARRRPPRSRHIAWRSNLDAAWVEERAENDLESAVEETRSLSLRHPPATHGPRHPRRWSTSRRAWKTACPARRQSGGVSSVRSPFSTATGVGRRGHWEVFASTERSSRSTRRSPRLPPSYPQVCAVIDSECWRSLHLSASHRYPGAACAPSNPPHLRAAQATLGSPEPQRTEIIDTIDFVPDP